MTELRNEIPGRISRLPVNKARYPVPWFVAIIDGEPDFRVIRPGGIEQAMAQRLCWVCGVPFLRQEDRAFTVGPMCMINRTSAEPPSHRECAVYSATACPFLTTPNMTRRDNRKPEGAVVPAGISIPRNPGVALVWVTGYRSWTPEKQPEALGGGVLFRIGEPKEALWFAHGRDAAREEVLASIDSGLPILRQAAEEDGPDAVAELEAVHERALAHVPAGASQ